MFEKLKKIFCFQFLEFNKICTEKYYSSDEKRFV